MTEIKSPYMGQETNGRKSQCSGMACFFIHSPVSQALQCSVKSPILIKNVSI